jgi:hypothetical protein
MASFFFPQHLLLLLLPSHQSGHPESVLEQPLRAKSAVFLKLKQA